MIVNCNKLKEFVLQQSSKIILALDWGQTYTGVAVTDDTMEIIMPCKPIKMIDVKNKINFWAKLIKDYSPIAIIIGIPKHKKDIPNKTAEKIEQFAKELNTELINFGFTGEKEIQIAFIDESNTSKQAEEFQHDINNKGGQQTRKKKRENLNSLSATLILRRFLDNYYI